MNLQRKLVSGLAIAAFAATAFAGVASAEEFIDIASGGNGGVSTANSNGGSVSIGTTNSGGSIGTQSIIADAIAAGADGSAIADAVLAAIYGG